MRFLDQLPSHLQAFRQEVWCCPICFDDVSGARCEQLPGCNHVFCTTCLSTHCRTLAVDGAVERVACPDPACRLPLPPHVLRAMLTEVGLMRKGVGHPSAERREGKRWEGREGQEVCLYCCLRGRQRRWWGP